MIPPDTVMQEMKPDRPISNDSIGTCSTEIFSPEPSDATSTSNDTEEDTDDIEVPNRLTPYADNGSAVRNQSTASVGFQTKGKSLESLENHQNSVPVQNSQEPRDLPTVPIIDFANCTNRSYQGASNHRNAHLDRKASGRTQSVHSLRYIPNSPPLSKSSISSCPQAYSCTNISLVADQGSVNMPMRYRLTPSQRYRLRKEQRSADIRNVIKQKEKFYDDQDNIFETQPVDVDKSLIFNIPTASYSTSSFLTNTKSTHKDTIIGSFDPTNNNRSSATINQRSLGLSHKSHTTGALLGNQSSKYLDEVSVTAIPGVSNINDSQYMQQTIDNLSTLYLDSKSHKNSEKQISARFKSSQNLPFEFKTASEKGLEDLMLVSKTKLNSVSQARPYWLPPMKLSEKKLHDKQIYNCIDDASREQLSKKRLIDNLKKKNNSNQDYYQSMLERGLTRRSTLQKLRNLIWVTPLNHDLRYRIYDELLQSDLRFITDNYVEPFEQMMQLLNRISLPVDKEKEIEDLIIDNVKSKQNIGTKVSADLTLLLQLKSVSQYGLMPGDELLFHHFIVSPSFQSLKEVWQMANMVQMTCFSELCREKYECRILSSHSVISHIFKREEFKHEFNSRCLNFNTWWNIMAYMEHDMFMWVLDIIVVSNSQSFVHHPVKPAKFKNKSWEYYRSKNVVVNDKIIVALTTNVLQNYHFGFNDLEELGSLKQPDFTIPVNSENHDDQLHIWNGFIKKWLYYYQKF